MPVEMRHLELSKVARETLTPHAIMERQALNGRKGVRDTCASPRIHRHWREVWVLSHEAIHHRHAWKNGISCKEKQVCVKTLAMHQVHQDLLPRRSGYQISMHFKQQ